VIGGRRERSAEWAGLPEEPTWDDTAALIGGLPLVITVNTAVAHLEGLWHYMADVEGLGNIEALGILIIYYLGAKRLMKWSEVIIESAHKELGKF